MNALGSLAGVSDKPSSPLAVAGPSPMMLLHYPLFAANVRILCHKDNWRNRGQSSLASTFLSIRTAFRQDGMLGVYRGGHLYLLHQVCKDVLRFIAEHGFRLVENKSSSSSRSGRGGCGGEDQEAALAGRSYRRRLATKYLIDAVCYPVLLASTRAVILRDDSRSSWQLCCSWCREEGALVLFSGLSASLLSTALDEIMDWVLGWCVDHCSMGSDIDMADKVLLKASGSSVASIFTAPVNYIGVIQRCQSHSMGMLEPEPISELVRSLPWKGSMWQFVMFGGVLALNVKLIQWKVQLQNEEDYSAE